MYLYSNRLSVPKQLRLQYILSLPTDCCNMIYRKKITLQYFTYYFTSLYLLTAFEEKRRRCQENKDLVLGKNEAAFQQNVLAIQENQKKCFDIFPTVLFTSNIRGLQEQAEFLQCPVPGTLNSNISARIRNNSR